MTIIFVVGEPGVGKTSAVRRLIPRKVKYTKPKFTVSCDRAFAGHYIGGKFDGADTVPYNGVSAALEFWESHLRKKKITVFDGDRFSNEKVLRFFQSRARVEVVHLFAEEGVGIERRKKRGGNQNASWIKGRKTKSRRFAELLKNPLHVDVSRLKPEEVEQVICDYYNLDRLSVEDRLET